MEEGVSPHSTASASSIPLTSPQTSLLSSFTEMRWQVMITSLSALAIVFAREAKWFLPRATLTHYVQEQRFVTELVPSSCVVLETSLKPCRHLRQIQPSTTTDQLPKMVLTATPRLEGMTVPALRSSWEEEPEADSGRSWSSYFDFRPATVTHTITRLVTARAASPAAMVTFSVRGCQPSHLPFGLPLCTEPSTANINATATARISSTKDVHYVEE